MPATDFYSFVLEEEDNSFFYQFITANKILYTVYFKIDEYSTFVDDFPLLLQNGYAFGFKKHEYLKKGKNVYDPLIVATIYQIVIDFFENVGDDTVLLYHCDISDDRQVYRNRLFDIWEKIIPNTNMFEKHAVEIDFGDKSYFLGFVSLITNPVVKELEKEFEDFSYFIIQPK